jgi:hypothetical protein
MTGGIAPCGPNAGRFAESIRPPVRPVPLKVGARMS